MLKNPGTDSPAAAASIATVKRYAPPNQRNRSLGRRKSGGVNRKRKRKESCQAKNWGMEGKGNTLFSFMLQLTVFKIFKPAAKPIRQYRLERANSYVSDGERNPIGATKSNPVADLGEGVGNVRASESLWVKLIPLHGCCNSEAFQLLNNRWAATMSAYNNLPEDSAERPVLYTRKSTSAWGHAILPHLLIQPTAGSSTGLQRDFLTELRQAMQNANPSPNP
ncbi:UNVERIFIED_CONTAM: hypothetical protein Scaly_0389400 [Sesamum calycinum]|uniref:Uncharacterized protein n=1 Tax=Sesamum calycinum TaxID=2727403 RepID=A0AAW2SD52_9LAMI